MHDALPPTHDLLRRRDGQGIVEYALILLLMVMVVVTAVTRWGRDTAKPMDNVAGILEEDADQG